MIDPIDMAPDMAHLERRKILAACLLSKFTPHAGQLRAIDAMAWARFSLVVCGRRWGKSRMAARRIIRELLEPERVVWNVGPTYDLSGRVFSEVLKLMRAQVPRSLLTAGLPAVKVKRASDSGSQRIIELTNGSVLQGKSADNPDSLLGTGLDLVVIDEASRVGRKTWEEYLLPCLLDRGGKAVLITTPLGFDWVYDLFQRGQDGPGRDPEWASIQSPSWENPYLKPEDIERFKSIMSKESFNQELGAQFTARSGRVFGDFSRDRHVRAITYDQRRPVYVGWDFGYTSCAWVAMQDTSQGEVHVFADAVYHGETTGKAAVLLGRQPWAGAIEVIGCDPAGVAHNLQTGQTDVRVLREAFPDARVAYSHAPDRRNPEWRAARIRDLLLSAKGETRLFVSRSATNTISMFESSIYPDRANAKEEPVKDSVVDHTRDALGYGMVGHDTQRPVVSATRWGASQAMELERSRKWMR